MMSAQLFLHFQVASVNVCFQGGASTVCCFSGLESNIPWGFFLLYFGIYLIADRERQEILGERGDDDSQSKPDSLTQTTGMLMMLNLWIL